MTIIQAKPGICALCGRGVTFARSSKGPVELLGWTPSPEGWIYVEEGFTHVYEDHGGAVAHLREQGFTEGQIKLYELHYCVEGG